jgi:aminotransferase
MALLEIGHGDEVVLPTIGFVGAANAVAANGARPVFCDVDYRTLNPTAAMIDDKITTKTKAILLLHYGGVPCVMDEVCALVGQRGIALIEDCAASVASLFQGKPCGTFGTIGVWSFDAMKILVTGDGGMVFCKSEEMSDRLEKELYLGLLQSSGYANRDATNWWEFDICTYGRRAIMNDIASAIGIEQLKKLPGYIARRREINDRYNQAFADLDWLDVPPPIPHDVESSYYLYWIQVKQGMRDQLAVYLREHGIYTSFRYYPLHLVGHYGQDVTLPNAEAAAQSTLCLPIHQSLSDSDIDRITGYVRKFGEGQRRLLSA